MTEWLAEFVSTSTYDDVPREVVDSAKRAIRDYTGVALFGSHHDVGDRLTRYVETIEPGNAATVIGRGTASATGAALANGTFGHAVDYDDTFGSIVIHPTSPVFPAALAAAELDGATGADVLAAYTIGVDVAYRVGHSTYPAHYQHGWHSTGTIGTFGAAAAASAVFGIRPAAVRRALGIAASSSSSLKKNFGFMAKPLHAGHAAQMGLRAALLAREGITADGAILEGALGYGAVMAPGGTFDASAITDGLGTRWAVMDIGFKPYPSGVITHAAMEAGRRIAMQEDVHSGEIETITVTLDRAAADMLIHETPDDELQAKFSIEFCLAAIFRERDVGIHEFTDEYVAEPATRSLMAKVRRVYEPNIFGGEFAGYGARVAVETVDGREFRETERRAPGTPDNPLTEERLRAKFFECGGALLRRSEAEAVAEVIDRFEELDAVDPYTATVRCR